jgi:hypothetical protein
VSARARIGHFERLGVLWNVYRNYPGSIAPIRDAELADWEIGFERAPQAELMKWA